ncbi:NucA/NucB deoxyribonuclease domain-containing protein [Lentzea chajnantorensis]
MPYRLLSDNPQGAVRAMSDIVPGTAGTIMAHQSRWTIIFTQMGTLGYPHLDLHNGELATHIADTQRAGLPGSPASGSPLTRQTDRILMDKNRSTSCPSSLPRPDGKQCDEYPFASTNQGAFLGGGLYSARMIKEEDNEKGGRELSAFYRDQRIINFDPFYVQIV